MDFLGLWICCSPLNFIHRSKKYFYTIFFRVVCLFELHLPDYSAIQVYQGAEAAVVEIDFSHLEDAAIKRVCPTYSGAGLILMNILTVSVLYY